MKAETSNNVDLGEVEKFERMANRWWDPEGEFKPLHKMNPIRANYIDLKAQVAEKVLLDVGCGGGLLSEAMTQRGAIVTAIDMAEAPLDIAQLHAKEYKLNIDYQKITAEELAEKQPSSFDIVTCLEMLEHVPNPESVIAACARLVKPGGQLFFSTINRNAKAYAMTILGAEYILKWLPKGTHEYRKFIRPSELAYWARKSDLVLNDIVGIAYSPLTQTFRIAEHDVDVNYIAHFTKEA